MADAENGERCRVVEVDGLPGGVLCFSCGTEVAVGVAGPVNATPFRGSPAFGSDFDGAGDLEVVVCDLCLGERSPRVARLTTTQVVRTRREVWDGDR